MIILYRFDYIKIDVDWKDFLNMNMVLFAIFNDFRNVFRPRKKKWLHQKYFRGYCFDIVETNGICRTLHFKRVKWCKPYGTLRPYIEMFVLNIIRLRENFHKF